MPIEEGEIILAFNIIGVRQLAGPAGSAWQITLGDGIADLGLIRLLILSGCR